MTQETNDVVGRLEYEAGLNPTHPTKSRQACVDGLALIQSQSARIAELEGALDGISKAFPIGPEDSISTWRNLANACRKHARDSLTKDSTSG